MKPDSKPLNFCFLYDFDASELAQQLKKYTLEQALFNMPPGDWAAGERGMAALPNREAEFRANAEIALTYALELGCKKIPCHVGCYGQSLQL